MLQTYSGFVLQPLHPTASFWVVSFLLGHNIQWSLWADTDLSSQLDDSSTGPILGDPLPS